MATLADVFRVIHSLKTKGVVDDYAIGGTIAALFYAEATRCFDLRVCVLHAHHPTRFQEWLQRHELQSDDGFVSVHGAAVSLEEARDSLQLQAIRAANTFDYDGVSVRVMSAGHLIAFNIGDRKSRYGYFSSYFAKNTVDIPRLEAVLEKAGLLSRWRLEQESDAIESPDAHRYAFKRRWHEENARIPVKEKVAQLLQMQRYDPPLGAKHRELKWWEKPWDIEP